MAGLAKENAICKSWVKTAMSGAASVVAADWISEPILARIVAICWARASSDAVPAFISGRA